MANLLRQINPFGVYATSDGRRRRHAMLKDLFSIPSSLESDDERRKRLLNILLLVFIALAFAAMLLTFLLNVCNCLSPDKTLIAVVIATLTIVLNSSLFIFNLSPKMPGWLGGGIFVSFLTASLALLGLSPDLYAGSGLIVWLLPMMVASLLLRPFAGFIIAGIASTLTFFFSLQFGVQPLTYYAILALFMAALFCWLLVKLLNQSLNDVRRQSANIEAILDTVTEGVLILDPQGNYVSANRALLKMIPEDKLREINNKPLEETLEWKHTVFSVTASLIPNAGSVVVFRDETRRHETDRAKDALLATASHELRTPLGSVMNYIELLMLMIDLGKVSTDKFATYLKRAHENSLRLLGVINNIIDQAQLQAGVLDLKRERCNLPQLLEKNRQLLSSQIREKNLLYALIMVPGVPEEIISDSERLHQVLNNLIGNAIKFTHRGGVTVTVSLPHKDTLSIEVADTGPGIPEEQLPDIFEVFRRGSNYAQREHQGAGLGLSIVKELVNRMDGQVSVVSTMGIGSVFTVSIPLILPTNE